MVKIYNFFWRLAIKDVKSLLLNFFNNFGHLTEIFITFLEKHTFREIPLLVNPFGYKIDSTPQVQARRPKSDKKITATSNKMTFFLFDFDVLNLPSVPFDFP